MILRVAIVTESFLPSINGVTNSVLRVLESLKANGHEAIIFAPTTTADTYLGYKVVRIGRFYVKQFPVAIPYFNLKRELHAFEPDVVHVAAPFAFGRQAIKVARRLGVPSIAIYQTDISGYAARYGLPGLRPIIDRIIGAIHRRATVNLAPTPAGAEYLEKIGAKNVSVWGRGVSLEQFNPSHKESTKALGYREALASNGETVIGFVGRLAAEKQVHRFKELFTLKNVSFLIVGDGPERANLETLFAGQKVIFTGKLMGEELSDAYAAMDIFMHCGTEETFGQTIQEAQAMGLAVVAPNAGGPTHLIESGRTGILVDHTVTNGYRDAVSDLLDSPYKAKSLGAWAHEAVLGKSWSSNNEQLVKHYRKAIDLNNLMSDLLVR